MQSRLLFLPTLLLPLAFVFWLGLKAEQSHRSGYRKTIVESKDTQALSKAPEGQSEPGLESELQTESRRALIEALDRIVLYEEYYRTVYGHYTRLLSRLGCPLPDWITERFDIHVVEASAEHILVSARSESSGRVEDLASMDQNHVVHANFSLPEPSTAFLRTLALRHLRRVKESGAGIALAEKAPYTGYFRYDVKQDSHERPVALAMGVKAPVSGLQVELAAVSSPRPGGAEHLEEQILAGFGDRDSIGETTTPGKALGGISGLSSAVTRWIQSTARASTAAEGSTEARLAQQIFRGETGRYAKNWAELSQVTRFKFDSKKSFPRAPAGIESSADLPQSISDGSVSTAAHSSPDGLQIEPIGSAATESDTN